MNKFIYSAVAGLASVAMLTGCIDEINPENSYVTSKQAAEAPNSYNNFVNAVTNNLAGQFNYWPEEMFPFDYGFTSFFLARDVMGQDIGLTQNYWGHYGGWYSCGTSIMPGYAVCQFPFMVYYQWVKDCNTVISLYKASPSEDHAAGAGIAHAVRAMVYMDLARMYAEKSYGQDQLSPTVPLVTESTTLSDYPFNPRATNAAMWDFIVRDLDEAEQLLANYSRPDKYTPDVSVVYGLKARAYQWMEKWPEAEEYAKKAQAGYTMMSREEYLDRNTGFNTPNNSWMLAVHFQPSDANIIDNDADSSWGSIMCLDMFHLGGTGCGYAANYGYQLVIDRHLYNTIPLTDFRRNCFIDFSAADLSGNDLVNLCANYSDYPEELAATPVGSEYEYGMGGFSMKFRPAGGQEGRENQYVGFCVSVPLMRVEEMKLIEAEAAGMQNEGRGKQLLTDFALTRDASYVYGTHNEQYYGSNTAFQNEIWWQRRVELWGEGFATYDIKRFGKGIIRSYAGTNHLDKYQWNLQQTPQWMTFLFGGTEPDNNYELVQNPIPVPPVDNSAPFVF